MRIVEGKLYFDTHFNMLVTTHVSVYCRTSECAISLLHSSNFYITQISNLKEISDLTEVEKIIYNVPKEEEV